jgi:hypothetical protein
MLRGLASRLLPTKGTEATEISVAASAHALGAWDQRFESSISDRPSTHEGT